MLAVYVDALRAGEDFLLERLYAYASEAEDTRSTSKDDWRMPLREPARDLTEHLRHNDDPGIIHSHAAFDKNPTATFGILEAQRDRERGVKFDMFMGLTTLLRQTFVDLICETDMSEEERKQALALTHRFWDKFEFGCSEQDLMLRIDKGGFDGFLKKPYLSKNLRATMKRVLEG